MVKQKKKKSEPFPLVVRRCGVIQFVLAPFTRAVL